MIDLGKININEEKFVITNDIFIKLADRWLAENDKNSESAKELKLVKKLMNEGRVEKYGIVVLRNEWLLKFLDIA